MYLAWNPAANVIATIFVVLVTIGLCYILYKSIKKEQIAFKEERSSFIDGILSKNEIISSVNTYINKVTKDVVFGVIYFNLDKFTETKNAFGESESDRLINIIAKKVLKAVPRNVVLGRLGGDNFLAYVKGDSSQADVVKIANLMKQTISEPVMVYGDTEYNPSVTISVAFYPNHGSNYKQLFSSLEIAMYTGKRDGGNRVCVYSEEIGEKETGNLAYYTQIKEAIKNNEFMLYYQPIIDVENKKVYGLEGLLRWNHPEHGVLSPNSFIHILEQTGDINWVGIWGVETLIKKHFELKRDFPFLDCQLSINLSPKQLSDEKLPVTFQRLVKDYKINTSNITIEILEYAVFERLDVIKTNITSLHDLGFKIAVDGFSFDQATISKLGDTPIDILKLDREFFPLDENAVIKERFTSLLIDYATEKNITIIAEGVEDAEMLAFAKKHSINYVQGYYFSKPISSVDVTSFINNKEALVKKIDTGLDLVSDEEEDNEEVVETLEDEDITDEALDDNQEVESTEEENVEDEALDDNQIVEIAEEENVEDENIENLQEPEVLEENSKDDQENSTEESPLSSEEKVETIE